MGTILFLHKLCGTYLLGHVAPWIGCFLDLVSVVYLIELRCEMAVPAAGGVDLSRKFVSETEIEEKRKQRQEEWEKVRKPEDPEKAPEEEYDGRSLFERLQEQKDKKQEEYDEQFKFKNMVKGLDEDESHFLDEVSRQQSLVEKQRRDEELHELKEYRSALKKLASSESRKEPERRAGPKPAEVKTSHLSQAHLLAGAFKRRSSSQSSDNSKKQKVEESAAGNGGRTEQEAGRGVVEQGSTVKTTGVLHLPSAAVCVGILPGMGAYSGSSDSESSSDSEV
ncbi:PSME3-interacting protein isoform X3 [Salmo salar]|uniref:PSME3-interacting protein isoform X3 n=3 Tax=Salmoninae TaxID=504568 RepID=A0A1S3KM63_SALSA|nr:PSME3-interacting protein isoform X3 [Salmo salar]|eukprot:XP_013979702.1 PREDICTED: protein FAM192A-like isoform X1 [Salmo salar]